MRLRAAQAVVPTELAELAAELGELASQAAGALDELPEAASPPGEGTSLRAELPLAGPNPSSTMDS
ncbi:hypothetical protein QRX50_29795 [Amycolatopsis carbonis]|uniref:Uncharacterized protein n=1 Tax=Amycolatopsis carbonis TaxID=715471 RepID=A0A9Y2IBY7_9PSEU|nr:hypothetical protein [Amycolatopsis sp. 2-15]WIX75678.1 hypothetical protein QRX50_29795 [Amycolatopsis sp. 2-15]